MASEAYYAGERDRVRCPADRLPKLGASGTPSPGRRFCSGQSRLRPLRETRPGAAQILRKPILGAVAAAASASRPTRSAVYQVDADLQAADRCRSEPTNIVPWHFDKALLVDGDLGQDADRLHPLPRLRDEEMGTITMIDGRCSPVVQEIGSDDLR